MLHEGENVHGPGSSGLNVLIIVGFNPVLSLLHKNTFLPTNF